MLDFLDTMSRQGEHNANLDTDVQTGKQAGHDVQTRLTQLIFTRAVVSVRRFAIQTEQLQSQEGDDGISRKRGLVALT